MRKIMMVAGALALLATAALADQLVAEFTGQGTANTRPFVVEGPWELQYEASGRFSVAIRQDDGDARILNLVSAAGAGVGASYQPTPGRYFLDVSSSGTWTFRVVAITPAVP